MDNLLALPFELQISLFAGYLGYKIAAVGRAVPHRSEDFILQVIAFGAIGRFAAGAMVAIWNDIDGVVPLQNTAEIAVIFLAALAISSGSALVWRKWLRPAVSQWTAGAGLFRDDLEETAWASITNAGRALNSIQVHTKDGYVYECDFDKMPNGLAISNALASAPDGLALYVNRFFRPNRSDAIEHDIYIHGDSAQGEIVTYLPADQIVRIDVGLRPEAT